MNDDKCYQYDELNKELLTQFSEGSKALENLLVYCYDNKIVTRACCIGHNERGENPLPYILMIINEEQKELIESVINKLFNGSLISEHINVNLREEGDGFAFYASLQYNDETLREVFFNFIQKSLVSSLEKENLEPGMYDGLLDFIKTINSDILKHYIKIKHDGILIEKANVVNLYMVDGKLVEKNADESYKYNSEYDKLFIKTPNIPEFISNVRENTYNK